MTNQKCGLIQSRTRRAGEALAFGDLPTSLVDHELGPAALIWTAKGGRKTDGAFADAQAAVLKTPSATHSTP